MKFLYPAALAVLASSFGAHAQDDMDKTTPLFASEAPLDITIAGPIREIVGRAERSTDPHPSTLEAAGEAHSIDLAARGMSRRKRDICRFPPLRISFTDKPEQDSLFHKQKRLKLVTHCQSRESYDQVLLREYATYRLYNVITPESLKVRLAHISYTDDGKTIAMRPGFLIEDADDAARRLDLKEIDTGNLPFSAINREDAVRYVLFQYLIGNTDWALFVGPDPTDCCHNSKLLGTDKAARRELTPLPYDFDNAGMVDAPYAIPNESLGTRSVKTRVYRGFCAFNDLVPAEVKRIKTMRPQLEAEIRAVPGLSPKIQEEMVGYLAAGFADFEDDSSINGKLLAKCR